MKCKYCGSLAVRSDGRYTHFLCGSWQDDNDPDDVQQSKHCKAQQDSGDIARYRAMFPVAPWDDGPITPEVCMTLGLISETSAGGDYWESSDYSRCVAVEFFGESPEVRVDDGLVDDITTAGQLSCLVAARRSP